MKRKWMTVVWLVCLAGCGSMQPMQPGEHNEPADGEKSDTRADEGFVTTPLAEEDPVQDTDTYAEANAALSDPAAETESPEAEGPNANEDTGIRTIVHPVTRSIQETGWYCGPAVMQMLLGHYGLYAAQADLADLLHTSRVTGTEYADMARVASVHVFGQEPADDRASGFRAWTGTTGQMTVQDHAQFLDRMRQDLEGGDVLSAAVDVHALYPDLAIHGSHVVLVNGIELDEAGGIRQIRIEDPSYLVDYASEEDHWFSTDRFLEAMNRCPEPGYIW